MNIHCNSSHKKEAMALSQPRTTSKIRLFFARLQGGNVIYVTEEIVYVMLLPVPSATWRPFNKCYYFANFYCLITSFRLGPSVDNFTFSLLPLYKNLRSKWPLCV